MPLAPTELRDVLDGVLTFPLTPFAADGSVDPAVYRRHLDLLLEHPIAGIFVGCGTGEFASLTQAERRSLMATAVEHVAGRVPVLAGVGNGLGNAVEAVRELQELGADGFLVFPPVTGPLHPDGVAAYFREVATATDRGLIPYQKDGFVLDTETLLELAQIDNVIGIKDGDGHVDVLQRQQRAVAPGRFLFLNGTPTAELFAASVGSVGVVSYSSAIMNFVPEFAMKFQHAFRSGDTATMRDVLDTVVLPFVEIRDRAPGYAVSLVKAAARLRGLPVGGVRAPLADPATQDLEDLAALLEKLAVPSWHEPAMA